ncbi:DUF2934 domain-containing protein [Azospirillum doebereinerae]|uniref:DUF2934 domain-containing protein n=1 Tax=Azospirillum doebereinerae TaxID=92933 RepID=UPI001EE601EE|nr:DUF2934 domain-containing protein [Azospirillum doebereinerae]MCG5241742.1 DUF2934 domain-containing protein [Azospirillum doebereinerae]
MSVDVEQRIRDRAYTIWLEQGCPHGQDGDHWLQAERDVAATVTLVGIPAETAAPAVKAPRKSAKKAVEAEPVAPVVSEAPVKARKPRARKTVPA